MVIMVEMIMFMIMMIMMIMILALYVFILKEVSRFYDENIYIIINFHDCIAIVDEYQEYNDVDSNDD